MMVTDFRCWWQNHVGDYIRYVGDFLNVLNRSPTSKTCRQHILSSTSVINSAVTKYFLILGSFKQNLVMTHLNLRVPDLFDVCIERCQTAQLECFVSCDNDLMCISECIADGTACSNG